MKWKSMRALRVCIPDHAETSNASRSPPCRSRGRQCDGQWVTTQHHQCNEPPDCPFAVRVGANKLRDVADRCGFGLDLPALGAQGGALGLEVGKGGAFMLALVRERRPALALPLNRRERRIGPAALGGFLDGCVDLTQSPVKITYGVGLDVDPARKGRVLRLNY